ncbi:MAG: hypothetical protein V7L29_10745 [Nostoc sp.]
MLSRSGTAQTLRCVVGVAQGREEAALTQKAGNDAIHLWLRQAESASTLF